MHDLRQKVRSNVVALLFFQTVSRYLVYLVEEEAWRERQPLETPSPLVPKDKITHAREEKGCVEHCGAHVMRAAAINGFHTSVAHRRKSGNDQALLVTHGRERPSAACHSSYLNTERCCLSPVDRDASLLTCHCATSESKPHVFLMSSGHGVSASDKARRGLCDGPCFCLSGLGSVLPTSVAVRLSRWCTMVL